MSIGVFSRSVGVPPSALRYYDELGLLLPAHVDPLSGYRFYDVAQNEQARLLGELRELGLSIAEMAEVLALPAEAAAVRLAGIATDRLARARHERERLEAVVVRLRRGAAVSTVAVDGGYLGVALERVASQAGDAPFDVVQWVVDPVGVSLLASDRFRLSRWLVRGDSGAGLPRRFSIPVEAVPEVVGWLGARSGVECVAGQQPVLRSGGEELGLPLAPGDGPDLADVFDQLRPELAFRGTLDTSIGPEPGLVQAVVDGVTVRFTDRLLEGVVASLVGGPVELCVQTPAVPVLLRSLAQPAHEVIVMPWWSPAG